MEGRQKLNGDYLELYDEFKEKELKTVLSSYHYLLIEAFRKINMGLLRNPMFCDYPTLKGAINVITETGIERIHSIIVNKYRPTSNQKIVLEEIKEAISGTDIIFPDPIKELSQIETLARKGKTVWESRAKILRSVQDSLLDVIMKL